MQTVQNVRNVCDKIAEITNQQTNISQQITERGVLKKYYKYYI